MQTRPWFRVYGEIVDDEKLRLLAFEDRWHFVAILAIKSRGLLDAGDNELMLRRKISVKLGLQLRELDDVARRLSEVGLIDFHTFQPLAWESRQFESDTSKERTRAWRERNKRHGDVTVTAQDTDTDTDTEKTTAHERPKRAARALARAPDGVTESVWNDFKALRREHRAPVTATALAGIEREARKAGLSLDAALRVCCERGWRGFKADWVLEARASGNGSSRAARFVESLTKSRGVEDVESDVRRIA